MMLGTSDAVYDTECKCLETGISDRTAQAWAVEAAAGFRDQPMSLQSSRSLREVTVTIQRNHT